MSRFEYALRFASIIALVAAVGFGLAGPAHAQISADRPGFGDGAATVAPGTFQAGLGYAFNGNGINNHELGQLLLRVGVTPGLELRGTVGSYIVNESPFSNGYAGSAVGTKVRFFQNETSALSGVATLGLPTGTGVYDSIDDRARQELKLVFDGALGEDITLSINGGTSFYYAAGMQDDRAFQVLFIPTLSFAMTEKTGAYVGYAGFYDDGPNTNWVEGGITFLPSADTQLDLNTGLQIDDNGDRFFFGVGVAHRF